MFTSLSNAITPKSIPAGPVNNPNADDVALPEDMKLEPLEDWDTIDDDLLSKLIYDTTVQVQKDVQTDEPKNDNKQLTPAEPCKNTQNPVQAQFNTINNTTKGQLLPQMYFPNSNVTINYHFHK